MKRTTIRRKHLSPLSSPTVMDKNKTTNFLSKKDQTECDAPAIWIWEKNTFQFIMMSVLGGCCDPRPEELLNSVQCAFLLLFNLSSIDFFWFDSYFVYFITITSSLFLWLYFFSWKLVEPGFPKVPKSLRSFPVRPTVWSFGASLLFFSTVVFFS